jgi:hypothetical protein
LGCSAIGERERERERERENGISYSFTRGIVICQKFKKRNKRDVFLNT